MAPTLTATKAWLARGLSRCAAFAKSSFPVPGSPSSRTEGLALRAEPLVPGGRHSLRGPQVAELVLELREAAPNLLFLRTRLGNLPSQGFGNAYEIALGARGPRDGGACGLEILLERFDGRLVPHQCVVDPRVLPFQPAEPARRREVVPRQRGGRCHEQRHEGRPHRGHE
jgi:hypothetical protein